jgi:GDP-L-fucose synthase
LKILITGGSSFIGRNLVEQYAGRFEVLAPGRAELDLLDPEAVRQYLEQHRFDAVIHAATERSNRALPATPELLSRNCRMFFNLARNEDLFGRMLFLSSGAVYDRAHCRPKMAEDYFDTFVPSDDYGFSKYVCAKAIGPTRRVYELRLFGVFGPHEDWRVRFISNACCRAVWDLPVVIRQDVLFDYMDVEDLGSILEAFWTKDLRHKHYNVSTGRCFALSALAEKVVRTSGKNLNIVTRRPDMGHEYSGDNARMLEEIPDLSFREMDESVARLYQWYEARKKIVDPGLLRFDE